VLLAARTESAAEDLLWGAMRICGPARKMGVEFVTAENQWAIRVGLEAATAGRAPPMYQKSARPPPPCITSQPVRGDAG
jgi:hypothetical protein